MANPIFRCSFLRHLIHVLHLWAIIAKPKADLLKWKDLLSLITVLASTLSRPATAPRRSFNDIMLLKGEDYGLNGDKFITWISHSAQTGRTAAHLSLGTMCDKQNTLLRNGININTSRYFSVIPRRGCSETVRWEKKSHDNLKLTFWVFSIRVAGIFMSVVHNMCAWELRVGWE